MLPSDQELTVSSIPGDMDEQPGRLGLQGSGQRKTHCYLYILVAMSLVLLITGVCAGTVMYFQMIAEVQGVDAKVSALKAEGEDIKSKFEGHLRNIWQFGLDQNWKKSGSKLYYLSLSSATWEKAREQCAAMGATLAMVKTQEEMEFLKKILTQRSWLGLNDLSSEGTWKWLDGTIPDRGLWAPGQPDDSGGREDCGEISGQLNDLPCDFKLAWICEKSFVI